MKKMISLAIVACLAIMAIGFSSCEPRHADPEKYPIAGHTYAYIGDELNVNFSFSYDFTPKMKRIRPSWLQIPLTWDMNGNDVTLKLATAVQFVEPIGVKPAGTVFYVGTYDPQTLSMTLTSPITPGDTPLVLSYEE